MVARAPVPGPPPVFPAKALHLGPEQYAEIVAHAREGAPDEVCGLIAGRGDRATRVFRCANVHPTPRTRYAMDPREQLRVFRENDEAGDDLVGIYHSHPSSEPRPSVTDVRESHYPECVYVLVSLRSGEPEMAAWSIVDGAVSAVALEITR